MNQLPRSDRLEDYRSEEFIIPITRAIASRVIRPPGVEFGETHNDCVIIFLRRVDQLLDMPEKERRQTLKNLPIGKWLWVRVLGDLRDIYKREWARAIDGPFTHQFFPTPDASQILGEHLKEEEVHDSKDTMAALKVYVEKAAPSPQYATVFERLFIEDKTQVQVAKELGISQPRVSSMKKRIQSILYDHLMRVQNGYTEEELQAVYAAGRRMKGEVV